jgi:hypothetical protein
MTAISKRQQILEAFCTRLSAITQTNGFRTNLGDSVLLGELPALGKDDPIGLAVLAGDEQIGSVKEHIAVTLAVDICVLVSVEDQEQPWVAIEEAIADVKQAIELADRRLGRLLLDNMRRGPTRTLPRESGSVVLGAIVTYFAPFTDLWGHPEYPENPEVS